MFGAYGVLWKSWWGGAVNFLNLHIVLGFTRTIFALINVSYNSSLDLYFAMHYLNNPVID